MGLRRMWTSLFAAIAVIAGAGPTASPLASQSVPSPTVRVVIEESGPDSSGLVRLAVRLVATGVELGAYQGTLEFEQGALEVVSATSASGDGTRVVNAADSAAGKVRFAGYAVPGFARDLAMTLVVRRRAATAAARVRAALEVAGDANGVPIAARLLIPASGTTRTAP